MILKVNRISKSFLDQMVLDHLSLEVKEKETVAICGRSGEGKTTLLHILGTLENPDQGTIEFENQLIKTKDAARIRNEKIGFIFQSYNLLEDFTTLENVLMPAKIARKTTDLSYGMNLLKQVGLEKKAHTKAKALSGGERQRVAIARALCNQPKLILADEPTGNLDRENAQKVITLLMSLNVTVILVTHDQELSRQCHTKYILENGKLYRE